MKKLLIVAIASAFAALSSAQVINGGFETGNLTGWTVDADSGYLQVNTSNPHTGTYALRLGATTADGDRIHQDITDSNGASYTLSFWALSSGGDTTNSAVHVNWNGTILYNAPVPSTYTQYTFNVTGSGLDTLTIAGWNSPAYNYVDDVTLTVVPEPASMAILGVGALALLRRRRAAK